MSVNSHLNRLAWQAVIRDTEKESIQRSIGVLRQRLTRNFRRELSEQMVFGSYTRGTILPRRMDENSDVDYMVVFADNGYQPQTYLNQLRRFVTTNYSRSEISQSHPTIVLNLNHIRFELVPAVRGFFGSLKIPAKASDFEDWIDTDPNGFNVALTHSNQRYHSLIKRLIRVMKYWNVLAGKPFESYDLEKKIVELDYRDFGLRNEKTLAPYFYTTIDELNLGWFSAQWKTSALERTQNAVAQARHYERNQDIDSAERIIRRLVPMPVKGTVSA
ncbi:MAG: nucleotidyltransferase [Candidatus Thiodiazotropha sp. (ex. Lucinisca nassula)]|nr:nucleotidyltransferase [Candidatus Thiodiazotropha sp. (ex. Lucinisca nassula)]MBW9273064.1 nucleotidyltransferase [Candidatus Thiodiazotropha sp. (ex. Lucinisca nassula)]